MIILPNKFRHNSQTYYENRGIGLEREINESNEYYKANQIALIQKISTPIKVVRCEDNKITEAYFDQKSTTDYLGIYKGKYIAFEAKTTKSTTSFPLSNILPHQIEHFESINAMGGISFIIFEFTTLRKYYIVKTEPILEAIKEGKKSLDLEFFETKGKKLKRGFRPPIDYLSQI